jgi:aryl-alcohol dehydrogenase-like predicted oxidoreductase
MNPSTYNLGGDLTIQRLGFGAMRLCGQPGNFGPYPDWEAGKQLIRQAIDLGVNFIDTAHAYGPGWNETLIGEALADVMEAVVVATKGGVEKTAHDRVFPDGRPTQLRLRCEESLRRLRLERIPLYQLHKPDPQVPLAESIGALRELRAEGKIQHKGLSNDTLAQIEESLAIVPIASVQNRFNIAEQTDSAVLDFCLAHGIAYLPWGPLAAKPFSAEAPLAREGRLAEIARVHASTEGQLALAWLLQRAPNIVLIPGTTSPSHLAENAQCLKIELSEDEISVLDALFKNG